MPYIKTTKSYVIRPVKISAPAFPSRFPANLHPRQFADRISFYCGGLASPFFYRYPPFPPPPIDSGGPDRLISYEESAISTASERFWRTGQANFLRRVRHFCRLRAILADRAASFPTKRPPFLPPPNDSGGPGRLISCKESAKSPSLSITYH